MPTQPPPDSGTHLRVWTNVPPDESALSSLRSLAAPAEVVRAAAGARINLAEGDPDPGCAGSDVAFGQPAVADVIQSRSLKWIHLSSAGYTRYDRDDVRAALAARGAILTNSSSVYADPCAQHVLAMMLAGHRQLPGALREQFGPCRWAYRDLRPAVRVLTGENALLVGFGAIGRRLAQLLQPFGMNLVAVRRSPAGDEGLPVHPMAALGSLAGSADHVINLLPSSSSTRQLFDQQLFAAMRRGARFYNVGRGDTVDQQALLKAMESGHLSAAFLDVTSPEPLPADHPLWRAPNCYITPHVAGGRQGEQEALRTHFVTNLRRYVSRQPLVDRVM